MLHSPLSMLTSSLNHMHIVWNGRQILVPIVTTLSFILFHALLKDGVVHVVRPISTCFQRHKVSTIIFLLHSLSSYILNSLEQSVSCCLINMLSISYTILTVAYRLCSNYSTKKLIRIWKWTIFGTKKN